MKKTLMVLTVLSLVVVSLLGTANIALAAKPDGPVGSDPNYTGPFLCPAVGNANAAAHNGKDWHELPSGDYTFLPGNNQAGAHANPNGYGAENPGTSPGPGNGNSGWGPIWPGDTLE